jgi:hypothetical protein
VLSHLEERSGTGFDPEVACSFVKMMSEWEPKLASIEEPAEAAAAPPAPAAEGGSVPGQG